MGRASFEGTVPPPRPIRVNKDEETCRHAAGEVQDVRVSPDRGLSEVVVEIHGVSPPEDWPPPPPEGGYVIRQTDCLFSARLLVVPDGAELAIHNDDPVPHNVNTGQWNLPQAAGSTPLRQKISYMGQSLVRMNCNLHSWMEMWVYLVRSPYHATTDDDGRFEIPNVPPGSYRATAIHPTLGTRRFRITIVDGQTVEQNVPFR